MAEHGRENGTFIYIADSAPINKSNLKEMENGIRSVSRLPAVYNECHRVIRQAVSADKRGFIGLIDETKSTTKRPAADYKACESEVTLYGKRYRAIVICSSVYDKRQLKKKALD